MKIARLATLAIASALLAATGPAAAQPKELRFGCYVPLTGQLAIFGRSMKNGFEMAIDDFAKTAQAKGVKFSIRCEDDQGRADDGINIARKFVEDASILAVFGSWSSTVTLAAGPIYNQGKLVNLAPVSSHPDVTKIGPYVYRQSITQPQEGEVNGAYLKALGVKTMAMIGIPNDYGKANIHFTKTNFEKNGGKVVFEEFVRMDAQDFRQTLQKALQPDPDMLYFGGFAPQTALMLKQLRQMGSKKPVYLSAANESPDLVRLAGVDAVEGVRHAIEYSPVIGPKMADFFQRYQARFGAPPDPFAGNSYNSATMMMEIVTKQVPNVTRDSIQKALDDVRVYDGIFGPIAYDPVTREWQFKFYRGVVEGGKARIVQ